ncbi:lipase [Cryobacterium lactosi]|uniref:Lipase n=1 Tax=Cryobacterium lactosi TaxID=1259202 RepID=A0A4R9BM62_9MICO|nr:SGNH/GDSL hydrolase family protein [Cryobacterium lactosi]TFD87018.1 lipase [Cryobacterium lactosi]
MTEWITTEIDEDLVHGAVELERTPGGVLPHRLPSWARRQFADEYLARVESQPSGVRLIFRTRATAIELDLMSTRTAVKGGPVPADGKLDLYVDGLLVAQAAVRAGILHVVDMMTQETETQAGPSSTSSFLGLPASDKEMQIWLPQTETTEILELRTDAPIRSGLDRPRRVWLHHGSSISHGSTAGSPSATWPAIASTMADTDLINLGFSGNALLDPFVARTMRDTAADVISVKIGINLTNTDIMRVRAFVPALHGFLDTIRDGHPTSPLLVVSPIFCPIQEDTPGPIAPDFSGGQLSFQATGDPADRTRLTLKMIRSLLVQVVAERAVDDPNLHYLDGRELFGEQDSLEMPLPDGLHPNPAGHRRIGERFGEYVFGNAGVFADR